MTTSIQPDDAAWTRIAKVQGLVCLVCGEPPKVQRRPDFYDTGLCRPCAEAIGSGSASNDD